MKRMFGKPSSVKSPLMEAAVKDYRRAAIENALRGRKPPAMPDELVDYSLQLRQEEANRPKTVEVATRKARDAALKTTLRVGDGVKEGFDGLRSGWRHKVGRKLRRRHRGLGRGTRRWRRMIESCSFWDLRRGGTR
jgi:hypothetical protein